MQTTTKKSRTVVARGGGQGEQGQKRLQKAGGNI